MPDITDMADWLIVGAFLTGLFDDGAMFLWPVWPVIWAAMIPLALLAGIARAGQYLRDGASDE